MNRLPYPGLRAFWREEADVFFGRDDEIDEIAERLVANRFLGVLGASGSGKSSLVRTGLLETLDGGFNPVGAGWRIADFHPGGDPIANLAQALLVASQAGDTGESVEELAQRLRHGPRSIVEWCLEGGHLAPGFQLLILADQFEELFNYGGSSARADAHVLSALLVESARSDRVPIYVVLTMRSDYFGACEAFPQLAAAISSSLFLTPRMLREDCQEAIAGPAEVLGFEISEELQNRLLNDMEMFAPFESERSGQPAQAGRQADQLPLMQYALNRMWEHASSRAERPVRLTIADYKRIEGLSGALDMHGMKVFMSINLPEDTIIRVFRSLVRGPSVALATRDPHCLAEIAEIGGIPLGDVTQVVKAFAAHDCQFLRTDGRFEPDSWVDITHESLIRQWQMLSHFLTYEADAADIWRNLASDAADWKGGDCRPDSLLTGDLLTRRYDWWLTEHPTQAWADRYPLPPRAAGQAITIADVGRFLEASVERRTSERRSALVQRRSMWLAGAAVVFAALSTTGYLYAAERARAEDERATRQLLQRQAQDLEESNRQLRHQTFEANRATVEAQQARRRAALNEQKAKASLAAATQQKILADAAAGRARQAQLVAERATKAMLARLEVDVTHLEEQRDRVENEASSIHDRAVQLAAQVVASGDFSQPGSRSAQQTSLYTRSAALVMAGRSQAVGVDLSPEQAAAEMTERAKWIRSVSSDRETVALTRLADGRAAELRQKYSEAAAAYLAALRPALDGTAVPTVAELDAATALIRLHRRGVELPELQQAADWCVLFAAKPVGEKLAVPLGMCRAAVAELKFDQGRAREATAFLSALKADPVTRAPSAQPLQGQSEAWEPSLRRLQLRVFVKALSAIHEFNDISGALVDQAARRWGANYGTEEASLLYASALEARNEGGDRDAAFAAREPLLRPTSSTGYLLDSLPSLWRRTDPVLNGQSGNIHEQLRTLEVARSLVSVAHMLDQRQAPYKPFRGSFANVDMPATRRELLDRTAERFVSQITGLSGSLRDFANKDDLLLDLQPSPETHITRAEIDQIEQTIQLFETVKLQCDLVLSLTNCEKPVAALAGELAPFETWRRWRRVRSVHQSDMDPEDLPPVIEPWFGGYDVAAYRGGRAVRGREAFRADYDGKTLFFANETNLKDFKKSETAYLPAYGGGAVDWLMVGEWSVGRPRYYCRQGDIVYLFHFPASREASCPMGRPAPELLAAIRANDAAWRARAGRKLAPAAPEPRYTDAVPGASHTDSSDSRSYKLFEGARIVMPAAGRIDVKSANGLTIVHADGSRSLLNASGERFEFTVPLGTMLPAGAVIGYTATEPKTLQWTHIAVGPNFRLRINPPSTLRF